MKDQDPPRWPDRFLRWFCSEEVLETLQGDLYELYRKRLAKRGKLIADLFFTFDVISACRPFAFSKRWFLNSNNNIMIGHYLKVSARNLVRHKTYSFLNILGLAIGMASSVIIFQYVLFERSYDSFHSKTDRIFRIRFEYYQNGKKEFNLASTYSAVGPALEQDYPEVESSARVIGFGDGTVLTYNNHAHLEKKIFFAETSFLNMFSFPLVKGDVKTALLQPNTMVISESAARRILGDEEPMGKVIQVFTDKPTPMQIVGVFKDVPGNSHIKFDFLVSYPTTYPWGWTQNDWGELSVYTYVLLNQGADFHDLQAKLPAFIEKYEGKALRSTNSFEELTLQPLRDIHLYSDLGGELEVNGNHKISFFLTIIAVFIMLIAWINYINISSANALDRAKEVGIRKVSGASQGHITLQFFFETVMINCIAIVTAAILILITRPYLEVLVGKPLTLAVFEDVRVLVTLLAILLFGILLTGTYPVVALSSFTIASVLKGKLKRSPTGWFLKRGLVVFQFTASIGLIIGTITVYQQIKHMQKQKLGIAIDQVLVVKAPAQISDSTFRARIEPFKNGLQQLAQVSYVAASTAIPGEEVGRIQNFRIANKTEKEKNMFRVIGIDANFLQAYQSSFVAGRNFSQELKGPSIIINETALKLLKFKDAQDAIGQAVLWEERKTVYEIIGVTRNYHQQSPKNDFAPTIFFYNPAAWGFFSIKLNNADLTSTINEVEKNWNSLYPGNPFTFFFLDDFFNQQYKEDWQFGRMFTVFSIIAIFIACLGLFSLSYFTAVQRTKEVGIRKVLGADVSSIISLLLKDFIKLIVFANLIAWPLSYLAISKWLEGYAFHIDITLWLFLVPGMMVMLIGVLTVSYHTSRVAQTNPVNVLRLD
ncbi:MAG TPA: ABC transporter permease [Cyclobacteriaceae bacterium]|nr:ABC transporter permease [Cyclobacteriaceae bacterium]